MSNLNSRNKYLQIALNSSLASARSIINQIPLDERIIIEAGTPLIKSYGADGIRTIRDLWERRVFGYSTPFSGISGQSPLINALNITVRKTSNKKQEGVFTPYIVADMKCMDRGESEVVIARQGGANAVTALGHAPIETLDAFIENCEKQGLDSMIDMMNVEYPVTILSELKQLPQVVILHRGVDEESFNREKEIPYHQIQMIKSTYDIMIAIAGGDSFKEVESAVFNDADIVVVWKSFYTSTSDTANLAEQFLKEIR